MKSISHRCSRRLLLAASSLIGLSSLAGAADLFWDANGETAGVGGTGNWSATAWRAGSTTGTLGTWVDNERPVFSTTAGIVTLDQNVAADGMNFAVTASEVRGSGTNAITFAGGVVTTNASATDITALLAGDVIFNPTAGNLSGASSFFIKANNAGLTFFTLNGANANTNIIVDDAGAMGSASTEVYLNTGIVNIGALTTEAIGSATANGSGGGISFPAFATHLGGGTIRSRVGANTWNGATDLTANSGLMTRGVSDVKLTFSSTATIDLGVSTLTSSSDASSGGIWLLGDLTGTGKIATGNFAGGGAINAAGATYLGGSNDYSGGTDVNFGSLVFLNTAAKPASGNVNVAATCTLGLGVGTAPTYFVSADIDSMFAGTFPGVTLAATSNVGIDTTSGDFIYAGTTAGTVTYGLSKFGANKLTLSGAHAYQGPTNVFGGTLALSGAGTFGTGALTLNGGVVDLAGQSVNIGALSVVVPATSGATITAGSLTTSGILPNSYAASNASGNAIIAANLLANGAAGLTKTGAGTLTLTGTNTYTGGTTLSAGTLVFRNTGAKPATGTTTPVAASTLALGVGASPDFFTSTDVDALLAGTLTNVAGTNNYTVGIDTTAGDFTHATNLGASARALTKLGANALTLSGNNTFDKVITLAEGTLKAGGATAFNNTGTLTTLAGTTFDLNGFDAKFISMTSSTATITTTGAGSGTDTFTLSASNVDGLANLFTDNGVRKLKVELTSATTPAAARLATTNANNTYSGGLVLGNAMRAQVPAGTVGTPGAISNGAFGRGPVTIAGGATNATGAQMWFSAASRTLVNDVIVNGNAGNGSRGGSFRLNVAGCVISGNVTANATDAWFGSDGTTTLLLSGRLTGPMGFRFFNSSGTNPFTITLNNATANPNDYAGNTTIDNSSNTLVLGAANQIPDGTGKGNVLLNFGKIDLAGYSETINGLTGGAATTIDNLTAANATNTLTLGNGDATGTTYSGVIANTTGLLSLVKTGTGTQTLNGVNTYEGTTAINGGTLALGALGNIDLSASVAIAAGAELDVTAKTTYLAPAVLTIAIDGTSGTSGLIDATGKELQIDGTAVTLQTTGTLSAPVYVLANYGTLAGNPEFTSITSVPGYDLVYNHNGGTQIALVKQGGSPYADWIDGFFTGETNQAIIGEAADPDNDGASNLLEFALNGNPNSGSNNGLFATLIQNASAPATEELTLIAAVRDGATFAPAGSPAVQTASKDGVVYTIEGSLDLVSVPGSAVSHASGPADTAPAATGLPDLTGTDWEYHTFKLDASEGLGDKGFLRVKAEVAP